MENSTSILLISLMVLPMLWYIYQTELAVERRIAEQIARIEQNAAEMERVIMRKVAEQEERLTQNVVERESKKEKTVQSLRQTMIALEERISNNNGEQIKMEDRCVKQVSLLRKEFDQFTQNTAFHAVLKNHLKLGDKQIAVFDSVHLNQGGGYNHQTGYFTVPVEGLYHFASSFLSRDSAGLHLRLLVNGNEIACGYGGAPYSETGSVIATVELKKGDIVGIQHIPGKGPQTMHHSYSSFTGFKV